MYSWHLSLFPLWSCSVYSEYMNACSSISSSLTSMFYIGSPFFPCAVLMSVCSLSSSLPLHYVSFSYPWLYFLAHLYYYFNCLWIHINSTSEHMPVPIFLSRPCLCSVPCPVFSQNLISQNSLLLLFFSFWADLVIITRLTGKDPSLVVRSDPKLITMVAIFL